MTTAPDHDRPRTPLLGRRRFLALGAGALLAACTGTDTEPVADETAAPSTPAPSAAPSPASTPTPAPSPFDITAMPEGVDVPTGIVPTRVRIPAIGVDCVCTDVTLTADEVEVPDFGVAGWWVQTRKPGEIGPAVIGGHVDTKSGPDVFFRLEELRPGDEITVSDDTGDERSFVVQADPIQVDKYERPPEVFGFGEARPELRLITCGGDFNPAIGHYTDNIVVFAHDATYEA